MSLFKKHTLIVELDPTKANAVLEKITGEFGKLIRENYDLKPFTGTIKEKSFKLIPNYSGASIKLKGTVISEGLRQSRIEIAGSFMLPKFIMFLFVSLSIGTALSIISITLASTEHPILGALSIFFPILLVWQMYHLIMGYPKSQYNQATYELMRKLDLHEYVL